MDKIDPVTLASVSKINPLDFELLDIGYDTHEEYYRSIVIGSITNKKYLIYHSISKSFESFNLFFGHDILSIDNILSGSYQVTSEVFLSVVHVADLQYKEIWKKFILSLTESELKYMLSLFENTLSLSDKYTIYISETLQTNIHITTCHKTITINKTFFENITNLETLRLYFSSHIQINNTMTNHYSN